MSDDFYRAFEDSLRGPEAAIVERLSFYHPLLETLARTVNGPALDLGCGRGEWLTLMGRFGLAARGVDLDEGMLEGCRARGVQGDHGEALATLGATDSQSLALVSAFHLVEHLPFSTVLALVAEARRVLVPGGVLLLETPNPENLLVGSCYFHTDPTHVKPLPPALLRFVAEYSGLDPAVVQRLNEDPAFAPGGDAGLMGVLKGVSPDYALLAQKPGNETARAALAPLLARDTGVAPDEAVADWETQNRREMQALVERLQQHEQRERQELQAELERQKRESEHATHLREAALRDQLARVDHLTRHLQRRQQRRDALMGWLGDLRQVARHWWFWRRQIGRVLDALGLGIWARRWLNRLPNSGGEPWQGRAEDEATGPLTPLPETARVRRLFLAEHRLSALTQPPLMIRFEGHMSGSYSLAAVNRRMVLALAEEVPGLRVQLVPREGEPTGVIRDITPEELARLVPLKGGAPGAEVALYHHFPIVEVPDPGNGLPVMVFFWEESLVPAQTIARINAGYRGVLVTCWLVKKALIDSGCRVPVAVVPMPLADGLDTLPAGPAGGLHFLHVSSCFPRKGVDILLQAFDRVLETLPEAHLTIKTFPNPHNETEALIERLIRPEHRERVALIMADYSDQAMGALYAQADAVVLPTRGEGLNLPAIEALRRNLPLVTTGYGAQTDFLHGDGVWLCNYRFALSQSHVAPPGSVWVDPDTDDLVRQCLAVAERLRQGPPPLPSAARETVTERYFSQASRQRMAAALGELYRRSPEQPPPITHLGLLSTWDEACGIAEYSRYLASALLEATPELALEVLAPARRESAQTPRQLAQPGNVTACWHKQSPLTEAVLARVRADEQPLWLQHHPGLFPLDEPLGEAAEQATSAGRVRLITLHATRPLLELSKQERASAAGCLNRFARVVVHHVSDLNVLRRLGVVDNTLVLPHGVARAPEAQTGTPEPGQPASLNVACFGFLMPHKGIVTLIEAFAAFIAQAPKARAGARLNLLNSLHSNPDSQHCLHECRQRIKALGLEQQVRLVSDFLPDEQIFQELGAADLVVLPYEQTPESASGAVRLAVAASDRVAVTPARIFDEVRNVTLGIDGYSAEAVERLLAQAWQGLDEEVLQRLREARRLWLDEHDWQAVAAGHRRLLEAAEADGHWLRLRGMC